MSRNRTATDVLLVDYSYTDITQMEYGVEDIDVDHRNRGIYSPRGPTGYHGVITWRGDFQLGRDLESLGSHTYGYNDRSIGVCLVGGHDEDGEIQNNFTADQIHTLWVFVEFLLAVYPDIIVAPSSACGPASPDYTTDDAFSLWESQLNNMGYDDAELFYNWKHQQDLIKWPEQ